MTPCPECRFDASAYTLDDVAATLRTVPDWWTLLTHDRDTTGVAALARRASELVRALPTDADADQRRALCHDLLHDLHLAVTGRELGFQAGDLLARAERVVQEFEASGHGYHGVVAFLSNEVVANHVLGCDSDFGLWTPEYGWWLEKRKNNLVDLKK